MIPDTTRSGFVSRRDSSANRTQVAGVADVAGCHDAPVALEQDEGRAFVELLLPQPLVEVGQTQQLLPFVRADLRAGPPLDRCNDLVAAAIGQRHALFYEAWAVVLERSKNFKLAEKVYQRGVALYDQKKFVEAVEEHQPDILGMSAFLTTTMPMFKANINALEKAGLRDKVIVLVGGAPVTQEYADAVAADGYAADAYAAVKLSKDLIAKQRAGAVTA